MLKREAVQASIEGFRLKDELEESGKGFQTLFNLMPDPAVVVDGKGNFLAVNDKVEEKTGFKREELLGKSFLKTRIVTMKSKALLTKILAKVMAGKEVGLYKIEALTKDGTRIPAEGTAGTITYMGKRAVIAVVRDITERERAEEALRESEEKFRSLIQSIPECVYSALPNGEILYMSPAVNTIFGYSAEEFQKDKNLWIGLIHKDDQKELLTKLEKLLNKGVPYVHDFRMKRKDGNIVWIRDHANAFLDEKGKLTRISGIIYDITERKKAEEELVRLSGAVKMSTDSIVISDLDGKIRDVNEATLKMYGTDDKEDLIGKNSFEFIAPEDRERALAGARAQVLEKGYLKSREYHIITKNGGKIPVEMSAAIMKDADDKPIGFVGISRDITQRRRAEEALRESEEKIRNIFDGVNDEILYIDKYGKIVDVNKRVKDIFGYKREEVIGKNFARLGVLQPKDLPIMLKQFMDAMRGGVVYPLMEYEIKDKKGKKIPVEASTRLIKKDGKIEGLLVIVRDIRERKKMEEKLKQYSEQLEELVQKRTEELLESEKRYSVLVEEASDGVIILQDGKIAFTNKKGLEIVGYSRDEVIGLPFERLVDEKHHQIVNERYKRRLRGEEVPATYEIEVIAKTGVRVPVELGATRINYQGRPADLVIVRDIRERKRMEEERLMLERLATIGEIATMVGHDLRNPLQSIENATYFLNNELPRLPIPQKATEMLQIINESINYADRIIRDLQDFSATKKPILKKTNINAIVKEALSQVKVPENVELITKLARLPEIKADKDMITRAFLNLATNGIQAMENGGTLKASTKKTKGFVEVSFKDTGVGIPKENMEKIFTPFFSTRAKGMGIGLPICKKFVDAHGGTIEVESEEGKGSTFTVKLPIQQ